MMPLDHVLPRECCAAITAAERLLVSVWSSQSCCRVSRRNGVLTGALMPCEMLGPRERPRTVGAFQRGSTVPCLSTWQWAHHLSERHTGEQDKWRRTKYGELVELILSHITPIAHDDRSSAVRISDTVLLRMPK